MKRQKNIWKLYCFRVENVRDEKKEPATTHKKIVSFFHILIQFQAQLQIPHRYKSQPSKLQYLHTLDWIPLCFVSKLRFMRNNNIHREKKRPTNMDAVEMRKNCLLLCACDVICGKNSAVHDCAVVLYRIDNAQCVSSKALTFTSDTTSHTQPNNHFACEKAKNIMSTSKSNNKVFDVSFFVLNSHSLFGCVNACICVDGNIRIEEAYLIKSCAAFSDEFIPYFYFVCSLTAGFSLNQ